MRKIPRSPVPQGAGRKGLQGLLGALALGLVAVAFVRCFSPTLPDCSYRCGPGTAEEPACPPEYECRADRYCHRLGTTSACPFTMDLATPADLRPAPDFAAPDLGDGDLGDGGQGD